ncbi:hypothetical protein [Nocardioides montaniterrae]
MSKTHRLTPVLGLVMALMTGLGATACSSSDHASKGGPSALPTPTVPYAVKLAKITGKLPDAARAQVRREASATIGTWWQAAYLSTDAKNRFPGFTPGAARLAARDADLMSNADLAGKIDSVQLVRRRVDLDVLAVEKHAAGATARVRLTYDTNGQAVRRCFVGGTVSLVPVGGHWQIFGFDVSHHCSPLKKGN